MPLTSYVIGVVTLVLVILLCLLGALCLAYVLYFHSKIRKERLLALRDFDSPWLLRIGLVGFAVLWSLGELLRLPLLRRSGWLLHRLDFASQANLCRVHVVSSIGFLEPAFFLTALFLVHGSLHNALFTSRSSNVRVFPLLLLFCLPVFTLQLILMLSSSSFQFHRSYNENEEGFGGSLPAYFTRSFEKVLDETDKHLALCTYPLFSILLLGLFGVIYTVYFSILGTRMLHLVINRKLRRRVYGLVGAVVLLLPLHVLFLGFSVRIKATQTSHEVLMFMGFLTLLLCTTVGEGILIVRPIADALSVCGVFENRFKRWQSFSTSPIETLGRSMSPFVSDDEESSQHLATQSLLLKSVSSIGTDADSSSKEASLTFDTVLQEITLESGSRVGGTSGPLSPPASPTLTRKPLFIFSEKCNV